MLVALKNANKRGLTHAHDYIYSGRERERESCIRDRPNYRMIKRNLNFALHEKHNVCKRCVCVCVGGVVLKKHVCTFFWQE